MHVVVDNTQELIDSSEFSDIMQYLVDLLKNELNLEPILCVDDKITTLGYGMFEYTTTTYTKDIPIVAIAPQKNNVSIYFMGFTNGKSTLSEYAHFYKKSQTSKSCLRVKKISDIQDEVFLEIVSACLSQI